MKTTLILIAAVFAADTLFSQIADRTETDCDGNQRTVYDVGLEGKPLIIASKGLDCSICMSHANSVGIFANTYAGQIEVWGAMTFLYNQSIPTCTQVENWENSYNWNAVFAFVDADEYWYGVGVPTYRVIHPLTQEEIYTAGNWTAASNAAIGILSLSSNNNKPLENINIKAHADGQSLHIQAENLQKAAFTVDVVNMVGQVVAKYELQSRNDSEKFKVDFSAKPGIYILQLSQLGNRTALKFVVI